MTINKEIRWKGGFGRDIEREVVAEKIIGRKYCL